MSAEPIPDAPPVGRLAPSPTGRLHLGHARSFLLAWWQIRARGGCILLRIEDLDATRVKPGMTEAVLRDLEWLDLDWDGPVTCQSERLDNLRAALTRLDEEGALYPCVCTRREIREAASAPHAGETGGAYPGTCRGRFRDAGEAREQTQREPALRFRTPPGAVMIEDAFAGSYRADPAREVGDFPVTSRDGQVAYQLAVVADDAQQGIDTVLRGDDLLPSTAQQWLLQRALGLPHPNWFHVPLVVDEGGRRLAKRSDDLSLEQLRAEGVDPRAVVAWVARSAGQCSPQVRRLRAAELVPDFDLELLPRHPAVAGLGLLAELGSARA